MFEYSRFIQLLRELHRHDVDYVLVGAAAMSVHGLTRATRDVDLFVRPIPSNVERLRAALRAVWNDPAVDEIRVEDLAGEYPTIRYGPPDEAFIVDLLARLGEAFAYEDIEFEVREFDGTSVRVATPRMLYRMKRGTLRPQDQSDALMLRERFRIED